MGIYDSISDFLTLPQRQALASVKAGQISPDSTIGQAIQNPQATWDAWRHLGYNPTTEQQPASIQPDNPGMEMGGVAQPIPPVGAAMGPASSGPAVWHGDTPGIPVVPPSLNNGLPINGPIPPRRPTSFSNAGQGFNNFHAAAGQPAQPLSSPPTPPSRPPQSTLDQLGVPSGGHSANQQNALADMLKAFGVNLNGFGQGVGHALDGIGQGINAVGTGIGDGLTGALNGLFHQQ